VQLHSKVGFDLVHQLNMVGFREPGYLWSMNLPFVWGPVGGMGLFPWRFLTKVGLYGAIYYLGYNFYNLMHMNFLGRPRSAAIAAGLGLIAATSDNQAGALKYWGCQSTILSEVGFSGQPVKSINARRKSDPFRIVWSGIHVPRKALNLGLEALKGIPPDVDWHLDILGVGRETASWTRMSRRYGIANRCKFHGLLPREAALKVMHNAHVCLVTSLRDITSTVIVEALSLGLPVVCPDHCGFKDAINEKCGIKIPIGSPHQLVEDMAGALERLARDETYRRSLARGAIKRAGEFTWNMKVAVLEKIYFAKIRERSAAGS